MYSGVGGNSGKWVSRPFSVDVVAQVTFQRFNVAMEEGYPSIKSNSFHSFKVLPHNFREVSTSVHRGRSMQVDPVLR